MNGNAALALGVVASGMEVCAMYPITPATSASHYLSDIFERVGCVVHQAEDEIAACAFAIGASYAGKCAVTITSGPGLSLKQEGLGLAVMGEIPLVVVDVQRGGPSTGQPTKAEQGDLLAACFGGHGDAPKVVMAVSSIEDCFYSIITARKIAETFNMVVVVLSDAKPRHRPAALPAAPLQRGLARPAGQPERRPRGCAALRLGSADRVGDALHPGPAERHALPDRAGPRPVQSRRLRPRDERGGHPPSEPQAGHLPEDPQDTAGVRRRRRRPAAGRLGQHLRRHRGGGRDPAREGACGYRPCTSSSCSRWRRASDDVLRALRPGHDRREQLERRASTTI